MKRSWGERVLGARSWDFGQSYKIGEILRLSGLGFLGMGGAVLPMRFHRFRGGSEGWLARGGLTHGIPWVKGEGPTTPCKNNLSEKGTCWSRYASMLKQLFLRRCDASNQH